MGKPARNSGEISVYFQDLTPYSYNLPFMIDEVFNVGWLDFDFAFPTGHVPKTCTSMLSELALHHRVNPTRGRHVCGWCGRESSVGRGENKLILGSAEIWVPRSGGGAFAAPDLIIHYIRRQQYMPPREFIEDCLNFDLSCAWDGHAERKRLVNARYADR
jgi:hypothetical protein